jgi:NAD(P)-dependent dehydrogenase (short-subunit alcohol dehydrogenase family)
MQLEGKRALITGAAQGIGKATALAFAREGAVLSLLDLNEPGAQAAVKACEALGVRASAFACDMTDEARVEAAFDRARRAMGGIDILVNTAAWLDPPIPVHEMPKEIWDRSISTDLTTVYLGCKHGLQIMIPQGTGGRVINMSSIAGRRGRAFRASYGAAKAAIINLSESIALEVQQYGITVNAVCPGGVVGERARNISRDLALRAGRTAEDGDADYERAKANFVTEDRVADLIVYLSSPVADKITGQNIGIG